MSLKTFRSDNGTEFVNLDLNFFFPDNGNVHQITCAYTLQQNGIAERKHRHMLDVAITLMFWSNSPMNLWSECILTAMFIINRTLSSVLTGKTSYELIIGYKSKYSMFRKCSCLVYVTYVNTSDKFAPRAIECVFIGYVKNKKAYKFYDLRTSQFFSK